MKPNIPNLIFLALFCFGNMVLAGQLSTGTYIAEREDVVETDTEIIFSEEIIHLNFTDYSCIFQKLRSIETKESIPYIRLTENGIQWKYKGNFLLVDNKIILELTQIQRQGHEVTEDSKIKIELSHEDHKLIDPLSGKIYEWTMK